jgi:hypothetical protein
MAGVGISYAGFTDSIAIFGTVETATVELEIIDWYSGTWVYKVWDPQTTPIAPDFPNIIVEKWSMAEEILILSGWTKFAPTEGEVQTWAGSFGAQAKLISYAEAGPGGAHTFDEEPITSDIDFKFDNLFPCIDFSADFVIHYIGSIPARIQPTIMIDTDYPDPEGGDGWLDDLYNYYNDQHPDWGITLVAKKATVTYNTPDDPTSGIASITPDGEVILPGYQLHYCDYIYVEVTIHIPQNNIWQGLYGEFFTKIEVIQWNDLCEETPQTPAD